MPTPPSSLTALIHASNRTRDFSKEEWFWNGSWENFLESPDVSNFPLKKKLKIWFQDFESQWIITVSCVKSCNFWMNPPESVEDREMTTGLLEYLSIPLPPIGSMYIRTGYLHSGKTNIAMEHPQFPSFSNRKYIDSNGGFSSQLC